MDSPALCGVSYDCLLPLLASPDLIFSFAPVFLFRPTSAKVALWRHLRVAVVVIVEGGGAQREGGPAQRSGDGHCLAFTVENPIHTCVDFSHSEKFKTSWNSNFSAARSHTEIKQNLDRTHQKISSVFTLARNL